MSHGSDVTPGDDRRGEPHIGADDLALLAFGEPASDVQAAHLAACDFCSDELAELNAVSTVGRDSVAVGVLLTPHPRVWAGIAHQLDLDLPSPASPMTVIDGASVTDAAAAASRRRRRVVVPLVAAAVIAVVVGLGIGATWLLRPLPSKELERATLIAQPSWPGTSGTARVDQLADGGREVIVSVSGAPTTGSQHEVWLLAAKTGKLVSLGILKGHSGSFPIPNRIDLGVYNLVDVSDEPRDGNPAHSGNSILRGPLSPRKPASSQHKAGDGGEHRSQGSSGSERGGGAETSARVNGHSTGHGDGIARSGGGGGTFRSGSDGVRSVRSGSDGGRSVRSRDDGDRGVHRGGGGRWSGGIDRDHSSRGGFDGRRVP